MLLPLQFLVSHSVQYKKKLKFNRIFITVPFYLIFRTPDLVHHNFLQRPARSLPTAPIPFHRNLQ